MGVKNPNSGRSRTIFCVEGKHCCTSCGAWKVHDEFGNNNYPGVLCNKKFSCLECCRKAERIRRAMRSRTKARADDSKKRMPSLLLVLELRRNSRRIGYTNKDSTPSEVLQCSDSSQSPSF